MSGYPRTREQAEQLDKAGLAPNRLVSSRVDRISYFLCVCVHFCRTVVTHAVPCPSSPLHMLSIAKVLHYLYSPLPKFFIAYVLHCPSSSLPVFTFAQVLHRICSPLSKFSITYVRHCPSSSSRVFHCPCSPLPMFSIAQVLPYICSPLPMFSIAYHHMFSDSQVLLYIMLPIAQILHYLRSSSIPMLSIV